MTSWPPFYAGREYLFFVELAIKRSRYLFRASAILLNWPGDEGEDPKADQVHKGDEGQDGKPAGKAGTLKNAGNRYAEYREPNQKN